jgi:hypothetical protein
MSVIHLIYRLILCRYEYNVYRTCFYLWIISRAKQAKLDRWWVFINTGEFSKDLKIQIALVLETGAILRSLENSLVHVNSKLHWKPYYYLYIYNYIRVYYTVIPNKNYCLWHVLYKCQRRKPQRKRELRSKVWRLYYSLVFVPQRAVFMCVFIISIFCKKDIRLLFTLDNIITINSKMAAEVNCTIMFNNKLILTNWLQYISNSLWMWMGKEQGNNFSRLFIYV